MRGTGEKLMGPLNADSFGAAPFFSFVFLFVIRLDSLLPLLHPLSYYMHQHHHSHRHRVDCPYATLSSATHSSLSSSSCSWACICTYVTSMAALTTLGKEPINLRLVPWRTLYTQYPRGHGEFEGARGWQGQYKGQQQTRTAMPRKKHSRPNGKCW